mmetsp:Transcript_22695/g.70280  ORF Transcript_22695/g.70280 Transcript_22695/m.70280 type:complete len:223 (+) Transcript_22695:2456-3124(+)
MRLTVGVRVGVIEFGACDAEKTSEVHTLPRRTTAASLRPRARAVMLSKLAARHSSSSAAAWRAPAQSAAMMTAAVRSMAAKPREPFRGAATLARGRLGAVEREALTLASFRHRGFRPVRAQRPAASQERFREVASRTSIGGGLPERQRPLTPSASRSRHTAPPGARSARWSPRSRRQPPVCAVKHHDRYHQRAASLPLNVLDASKEQQQRDRYSTPDLGIIP